MKKLFAIIALVAACSFGTASSAMAQNDSTAAATDTTAVDTTKKDAAAAETPAAPTEEESENIHKVLKTKFIEGDAGFMSLVAVALVLGLAFCIERVIYLTLAKINSRKFTEQLAEMVAADNVEGAIELCKNTAGPVAQVSRKALTCLASEEQNEIGTIERTINTEAEIQGTYLEQHCSWITFFIASAPSLGFLGTVIGMVMAFDTIEKAGDISPTVVAGGMKVALITTIFGIIVALVLQLFYNFILGSIESLASDMEQAGQDLLTMCVKSPRIKK